MAGSLSHIVNERGMFTLDSIDNMGDASEALQDCVTIIAVLACRLSPLELVAALDASDARAVDRLVRRHMGADLD